MIEFQRAPDRRGRRLAALLLVLAGLGALQPLAAGAALAPSSGAFSVQDSGPGAPASGPAAEPDFMPVDDAFLLGAALDVTPARVFWQIAPGYYLYRHRLKFALQGADGASLGPVTIPDGLQKTDDYFGDVEVYHDNLEVKVSLPDPLPAGAVLEIGYQGCAEAGLCYPPQRRWLTLTGAAAGALSDTAPASAAGAGRDDGAEVRPSAAAAAGGPDSQEGRLTELLGGGSQFTALGLFFVAGIALAFTPCVLPMVPILSSIIAGQQATRGRALVLSAVYVLAMALTYALLGTLVGLFGGALNLNGWLQSPPVLIAFAALFVLLSLSMFGVYELQLPAALRARLEQGGGEGGRLAGVALMGVFSSLLVSPCVSAPLAGALVYISATGDALLGGLALFVLALGMGVPLMIVGVGGGALLPRAGAWMTAIKAAFGVLLLGVAVWLLERVLPGQVTLLLWAALLTGSGLALGALDFAPRGEGSGARSALRALGVLMLVWGVLLVVGAAAGAVDPLRPLGTLTGGGAATAAGESPDFAPVADLAGVERALARSDDPRPLMLDLYADWCISCKVMERNVFPKPQVRDLLGRFRLLRADVTDNTEGQRALLDHYGLFGPPSMLFFGADGRELTRWRLQGELGAEEFARHLRGVLDAAALPEVGARG